MAYNLTNAERLARAMREEPADPFLEECSEQELERELCNRASQPKRKPAMNYSKTVFVINKHAVALKATYEADPNAKREMFKTFDHDIKVDDLIIVPSDTRHKFTVCKVVEIDSDIDFDADDQVRWVVGVIDRSGYDKTLAQEADAIKAVKAAELRKKRDDLAASMLKNHMDEIKALPIAAMNGNDTPPAQG